MEKSEYIKDVKLQLNCNASEDYKNNHITYIYTNEDVNKHINYFEKCQNKGLSPYKSLLFFHDYLNGDYDI